MFGRSTNSQKHQTTSAIGKRGMTPSVIAADMNVLGNVISDGMLDIDGKIEGNVRCHTVSIRENGRVKGDVIAEVVHVYGVVEGLLKATSVMLYSSAKVTGTVMHESLTIEDGAFIDGKLKRTDKIFIEDEQQRLSGPATIPLISATFENDNDNEDPTSEEERIVLENLRLIR
jgi:cytoskeletal protein CcmA (bactofilin family)